MFIESTEITLNIYNLYKFLVGCFRVAFFFFFFFLNLDATGRHTEIIATQECKIRTMFTAKIML